MPGKLLEVLVVPDDIFDYLNMVECLSPLAFADAHEEPDELGLQIVVAEGYGLGEVLFLVFAGQVFGEHRLQQVEAGETALQVLEGGHVVEAAQVVGG